MANIYDTIDPKPASNPYDALDPKPSASNPYDQFDPPEPIRGDASYFKVDPFQPPPTREQLDVTNAEASLGFEENQKSALYKRLAARVKTPDQQQRFARFVKDTETPPLPVDSAVKDFAQAFPGAIPAKIGRVLKGAWYDLLEPTIDPDSYSLPKKGGRFRNLVEAITNPAVDTLLPKDAELAMESDVFSAIQRGLGNAVQLTGEMAILPPVTKLLRIPSAAIKTRAAITGATFAGSTYAQTGDIKEAAFSGALGIAFPMVSAAASRYASGVTKDLLAAGKITNTQAKVIESGIVVAAMQAAIQGLAAPQYLSHPEKWKEIFAENAAMGLAFHVGDVVKVFDPTRQSVGGELVEKYFAPKFKQFVMDVSGDLAAVVSGRKNLYVPPEPGPIGVIPEGGTIPQPRQRMRVRLPKKESETQDAIPITSPEKSTAREPVTESPQSQAEVKATPGEIAPDVLKQPVSEEIASRQPGSTSVSEIKSLTDADVLMLNGMKDESGVRRVVPQNDSVIAGMKLTEKDVPELQKLRDKAQEKARVALSKNPSGAGGNPEYEANEWRRLWFAGAIEGAKREGGNYDAVVEQRKAASEPKPSESPKAETAPEVKQEPAAPITKPSEVVQKYKVGKDPHLVSVVERLKQTETEKENGEQPVRVKDDQTGKLSVVDESDLTPVKERTAEEKAAAKSSKRDLDKELIAAKMDPASFSTDKQKRDALKRAKRKGLISGSKAESWADEVLRGGGTHGGTDVIAAYIVKGAALIESGVIKFADWSKQMIDQYGEKFRPYLQTVWENANKAYEEAKVKGEPPEPPEGGAPVKPPTPPKEPKPSNEPPAPRLERHNVGGVDSLGAEYVPEKISEIQGNLRKVFFDSQKEVEPANTDSAWNLAYKMTNPDGRIAFSQEIRNRAGGNDMAPGLLVNELWEYSLKLATQGDSKLLKFLVYNDSEFARIGEGGGLTQSARDMRAALERARGLLWQQSVTLAETRAAAAGKTLGVGEEAFRKIEAELLGVKVEPTNPLLKPVEEIMPEITSAEYQARRIMDRLEKRHGAEWVIPDARKNEVREIVAEFLRPKEGKTLVDATFTSELKRRLQAVGVEEITSIRLAKDVYNEALARFMNTRDAAAIRISKHGSLQSLMEAIQLSPYRAQQDPAWRQKTAEDWFMANGLSREQAEASAKLFSTQYEKALQDARERLAERFLEGKKESTEMLIEAIRLGLTDPSKDWGDSIASRSGWKPMTPEQHSKVASMELKLSDPALSPQEVSSLHTELMNVFRHVGPEKADGVYTRRINEGVVASLLSGIRTFTVQWSPMVAAVRDLFIMSGSDPKNAKSYLDAMWSATKNTLRSEMKYAWQKDAYSFHLNEADRHHHELKTWWEKLDKEYSSTANPAKKAWVRARQIYAFQQFVSRTLSTLDQGFMATTKEWKLAYYSSLALKEAGLSTSKISDLVDAMALARQEGYEKAIASGLDDMTAKVRSSVNVQRAVWEFVENKTGSDTLANQTLKAAENDAYSVAGRRAEGIKETDEGMLSKPMNWLLEKASEARSEKGLAPTAAVLTVGFINVPFRTMRYFSSFSPYGLLRYGIYKYRTDRGLDNYWKQSFSNNLQARARLREAIAGTIVLSTVAAISGRTSDDDAGKESLGFYITGNGPSNKVLREAWIKAGWQPYSMVFVIGGHKVAVPVTRIGEAIMSPMMIPAAMDDYEWKKKERAAAGRPITNPVSSFVGTLVGTHLAMMGQKGIFQQVSQYQQALQGEGGFEKATAKIVSSGVSALVPFKQMIATVSNLLVGPLDQSSIGSVIANNFPILGLPFQHKAVNRFGDPLQDRSWYAKIYRLGVPVAFQVERNPENVALYEKTLLQKGIAPPALLRYQIEEKYGPLSDDQWARFAKDSGQGLKQETQRNLAKVQRMDPEEAKKFLNREATAANTAAASRLGLERRQTASQPSATSATIAASIAPQRAAQRVSTRSRSTAPRSTRLRARGRGRGRGRARIRVPRLRASTRRTRFRFRQRTPRRQRLRSYA